VISEPLAVGRGQKASQGTEVQTAVRTPAVVLATEE
jgi:hypothetical protein